MDAQKRQKLLLVVVAVLALGAGSYWFIGRDSDSGKTAAMVEGPVARKERAAVQDNKSRRNKETKTAVREEPAVVERKEREAPDDNTVKRKEKREDKTKEKKKAMTPAA